MFDYGYLPIIPMFIGIIIILIFLFIFLRFFPIGLWVYYYNINIYIYFLTLLPNRFMGYGFIFWCKNKYDNINNYAFKES